MYFNDYIQLDSDVVVGATDVMSSFVEDRYEFETLIIVIKVYVYNYVMEWKFRINLKSTLQKQFGYFSWLPF